MHVAELHHQLRQRSLEFSLENGLKVKKNLRKSAGTTVTQKQTAMKARGEGRTAKTFERKEENTDNETELKGTTNKAQIRRSQRLSAQVDQEKARPSGEFLLEWAEQRNPSEQSVKKTAEFTPEGGEVTHEKQKTRSTKTAAQFSETVEMKQHQTLTREMQKLGVDGGDQCEASNPNLSTKTGAENAVGRREGKKRSGRDSNWEN